MAWQQLTLTIRNELAEIAEGWLLVNEALSVTFTDAGDEPVFEPALGTTPLWQEVVLLALFDEKLDVEALVKQIPWEGSSKIKIERIEDRAWEREWMKDFHPMQFGKRLWVCPTNHAPPEPEAINLMLDPGLAFGSGTHPTTALCLAWLDDADLQDKTIIDYGCGSGVLALAALLLGAKHAWCIDIDPQALEATLNNAQRNGIDTSKLSLALPQDFPANVAADLTLANILAQPLCELAPTISEHTKKNGNMVLSGVLAEQADNVHKHYLPFADVAPPVQQGDWVRIDCIKKLDSR